MDFLCYYENGYDRGMNAIKGKGYGRENYKLALQYICKAAKKYGVFTSLVMPNMHEDAALEREYGNMARIVGDTWSGGIMCLIPIAAKYLKIGPVVAICSMALRTGLNTPDVVK